MIIKYIACTLLFFVFSCSNIEFVLKDSGLTNPLKNKTLLLIDKNSEQRFVRSLYSYFGNNEKYEYILKTVFLEKKENRIVKNNQVAEKIDYTLDVDYTLFYKTSECKVFKKTIISKFSFTPKSAGYNFGSDKSFERLYSSSIDKNISNFNIRFIGNKSFLSKDIKKKISKLECIKKKSKKYLLIYINYSGREDISKAASSYLIHNKENKKYIKFQEFLLTKDFPDPDILIRTGGYSRLSDFLIYQMTFTELFFYKKLWPDLTKIDLIKIFKKYYSLERKFGL